MKHGGGSNEMPGVALRPWSEVAAEFERRTGERISRGGAMWICRAAERKLRKILTQRRKGAGNTGAS